MKRPVVDDRSRLAPLGLIGRRHAINHAATCSSKERFETAAKAHDASRRIAKRKGTRLHVYHCRTCDGFHLTSRREEWAGKDRKK